MIDPGNEQNPLAGVGLGTGIYGMLAQLVALAVGAFAAGRLAAMPQKLNSGLHGVAVWALATLVLLYLATTAVGSMVGGAASAVSSASQATAQAVQAAVPNDLSLAQLDEEDIPAPVRQKLEEQGMTVQNIQQEAQGALQSVIGEQERTRATDAAQQAASDIASNPGNAGARINELVDTLFGGSNAVISEEDRQEARSELQSRLGISESEAEELMSKWETQAEQAAQEVQSSLEQAQKQATEAAQQASDALTTAALAGFAVSIIGLIVAFLAAMLGRNKDAVVATEPTRV